MASCEYCGEQILFGGVRVGRLRYCRKGCLENAEEAEYRIGQARLFYQEGLARLRNDPTNPRVREQALEAGRIYAAARRHRAGGRVTAYDEASIANDLEAASAAASVRRGQGADDSPMSIEERLERLAALRSKKLISNEEYETTRSAILAEL